MGIAGQRAHRGPARAILRSANVRLPRIAIKLIRSGDSPALRQDRTTRRITSLPLQTGEAASMAGRLSSTTESLRCRSAGSAALHLEVAVLLDDVVPRAGKHGAGEDRQGRDCGEDELGHCSHSFRGGSVLRLA